MSQNFEMKINPLPAKTWNWLHMNGTVLKEEIITERGTVKDRQARNCNRDRMQNGKPDQTRNSGQIRNSD